MNDEVGYDKVGEKGCQKRGKCATLACCKSVLIYFHLF